MYTCCVSVRLNLWFKDQKLFFFGQCLFKVLHHSFSSVTRSSLANSWTRIEIFSDWRWTLHWTLRVRTKYVVKRYRRRQIGTSDESKYRGQIWDYWSGETSDIVFPSTSQIQSSTAYGKSFAINPENATQKNLLKEFDLIAVQRK